MKKEITKKRTKKAAAVPDKPMGKMRGMGKGPRDGSGPNPNCPKKKGGK